MWGGRRGRESTIRCFLKEGKLTHKEVVPEVCFKEEKDSGIFQRKKMEKLESKEMETSRGVPS